MSRAERLLSLMQNLRRRRRPVPGAALAAELGISLRTLYRDIASLQSQGARIAGEPGLGYVLEPGFVLPPLMLLPDEVEALGLGCRWVAKRSDPDLAHAARNALAKIAAVLPGELRHVLDSSPLLAGPADAAGAELSHLPMLRRAIRSEHKLTLQYRDEQGRASERTVWPIALGFFERARMLAAWCELREDMRHFRVDRMAAVAEVPKRYPRRRQALLRAWRQANGIAEPD